MEWCVAEPMKSRLNFFMQKNVDVIFVFIFFFVATGLWKGLGPRIIMIGTLTALQWFIYDSVKVFFRLPRPPPPEEPESLKKKRLLKQQAA